MDETESPPADVSRAVARLSTDYVLRTLRLLSDIYDGDLLSAIVGQAIIAANTAHLANGGGGPQPYAGRAEAPPDEARRPVSVLAVADALGLPFETTRRRVNKLIAAGLCRRVPGGVIIPTQAIVDPTRDHAAETNVRYVLRFVRSLRRAGLELD